MPVYSKAKCILYGKNTSFYKYEKKLPTISIRIRILFSCDKLRNIELLLNPNNMTSKKKYKCFYITRKMK